MDILKKEMERKRKEIESADLTAPDKKFFRRGDLAAKQQEQYWKKYQEKHASQLPQETNESSSKDALHHWEDDTSKVTLTREEGYRNDLQDAMDQVDEDYIKEIIHGQSSEGKHDVVVDDEGLTLKDILDQTEKDLGKGNVGRDCELILMFYNFVIYKWGKELNARAELEKRSARGKLVSATHTQTQEYLKPLFRKLKSKTISNDIREHLVNITQCLLKRDYIQANNCYMEMAIGNAPWPVGVTASGIHKRPGSEKLYVKNVAHVLNDETQRKYIQALKRLMTKCQVYFPNDPSRCVEYGGIGGSD